jgi:hypothetical protein
MLPLLSLSLFFFPPGDRSLRLRRWMLQVTRPLRAYGSASRTRRTRRIVGPRINSALGRIRTRDMHQGKRRDQAWGEADAPHCGKSAAALRRCPQEKHRLISEVDVQSRVLAATHRPIRESRGMLSSCVAADQPYVYLSWNLVRPITSYLVYHVLRASSVHIVDSLHSMYM